MRKFAKNCHYCLYFLSDDGACGKNGKPEDVISPDLEKDCFDIEPWAAKERLEEMEKKINTPEIKDFLSAVENEAKHQRLKWGAEHDAGKTDADWFWLIGYLAGKAINKPEKRMHHIVTTAAACLNWHAQKIKMTDMRPGIDGERCE